MRHALALICPPLALRACGRPYQAALAAILFVAAIVTLSSGLGVCLDFLLILWANKAVGDEDARRETSDFIRTVKPIPVIHE